MIKNGELVAGILCGFIGLLIGSFWISGINDWIVKSIASIGSIATAGSFIYIIVDNRKIRKAQKEQEHRQIEHEKKQQDIWSQQYSTLNLQAYETHFKQFEQRLESLVKQHNNVYRFNNPFELYKQLFPSNSLESGIELKKTKSNLLTCIRQNLTMLILYSDRSEEYSEGSHAYLVDEYIKTISSIVNHYLKLEYTVPAVAGDIVDENTYNNGPHKVVNALSIEVERHIADILNQLSHFSNEDVNSIFEFPPRKANLQTALISFLIRNNSSFYKLCVNHQTNNIKLLIECKEYLSNNAQRDVALYNKLHHLLSCQTYGPITALSLSSKELEQVYFDCFTFITTRIDENEQSIELSKRLFKARKKLVE
ncbi:hypothetical protein F0267_14080 [Vibrio coralliilyticus]|uniref:Uncharacterized protein n=1 Tax=Vibrio coralliilyticus TaxID=190893 RepID=A0AAN0SEM2_9VIBR|nr:hypothetical protein [Vibrio coralliilyticus]AIW21159.1 hypothetical protein IX92_19205 [Vibrio coralliilyticus]NOH39369.1 hypothetical protein [Vibrio coralliilyticus]